MMTAASAEGEALRFSANQYSPASLVYSDDQWADSNLGVSSGRSTSTWAMIDRRPQFGAVGR
eukprot:9815651-Alexandrium_andersonii.AAC.1